VKDILHKINYSAKPEICMDVGSWAQSHGIQHKAIHPPLIYELEKYEDQDFVAKNEISAHRDALERSQSLVLIEGASVRDGDGIVELPDGQICYEGNWWIGHLTSNLTYQRRFEWRRRFLKGDYYSLLSLWSSHYFHWFHDVMPRLHTALVHLPKGIKFLINEDIKEYQEFSLRAYGIHKDNLVVQPSRISSKIERLWFATPLGHSGLTSGKVLKAVAAKIKNHFRLELPEVDSKKLYISRKYAASRHIENEEELFPIFKENGIKVINCENMPFLHQVAGFSSADLVIGPHGAGLTNSIFCPMESQVIEIAPKIVPSCYLISCREMGLDFNRLPNMLLSEECPNSNMLVDCIKLNKILNTSS